MDKRIQSTISRSRGSVIEVLESRIAPASTINASLVGGVLTITGDAADHTFSLGSIAANTVQLMGSNGTLIALNGAAPTASVLLTVPLSKVSIDLGASDDNFVLDFLPVGTLSIDAGDGKNQIQLDNVDVAGAFSIKAGSGDDLVLGGGTILHVGGPLNVDLGEGSNAVSLVPNELQFDGPALLTGGSGDDSFFFAANVAGLKTNKITANLGAGDNSVGLNGVSVETGAISVTNLDHTGTASFGITAISTVTVKGGITLNYGTGSSSTFIQGNHQLTIGGALKINSTGGTDGVTLGSAINGPLAVKGVTLALGDGANTFTVDATQVNLGSLSMTGGADADVLAWTSTSARMTALTLNLGDGANQVGLTSSDVVVSGLAKVTTGAGDDGFSVTADEQHFGKGLSYQAGGGVNTLAITGHEFLSGSLQVNYGSHATGSSTVSIATDFNSVSGPTKITTSDGDDTVSITGNTVALGAITAKLGDGTNGFTLGGGSVRAGAVSIAGGGGADAVVLNGQEVSLGSLKTQLGAGSNAITSAGQILTVSGPIQVTGGADDDAVNFTNEQQITKGAILSLGDGVAQVTMSGGDIQMNGPLTVTGGDHTGSSSLTMSGFGGLTLGAVSLNFGNGDSGSTFASRGPSKIASIKVTGGDGGDGLTIGLIGSTTIGKVSFQGGNGDNGVTIALGSGVVGAVKYTGGDGDDTLSMQSSLAKVASVIAQMGGGAYGVSIAGFLQSTFAGPVSISANNTAGQAGSLTLADSTFASAVSLKSGDGVDTVSVSDSRFAGTFGVATAGGDDQMSVDTTTSSNIPTEFRKAVTVLLGDGADTLAVGANTATEHAEFKSTVKFDGGAGMDTAHISAALFANVYITGQPVATGFETQD